MTNLHIKNARVIDPLNSVDEVRNLYISDGKFTKSVPDDAQVINADGLIACPGFIDLYARLREPGFSRKGTIESESRAALKAGFTTVHCAPDTDPVIDSIATVELIKQKANSANHARIVPIAALTKGLEGERLTEMATLYRAGCRILGHADKPIKDTGVLLSVMEYASSFDLPVMIRPIDDAIAGEGCAHAGAIATRLGLPGIPVAAETVALSQLVELSRSTGCRLHLSRLSSARAIELVRQAKNDHLPISADVGIHHLFFTHEQIGGFDVNYHSAVPFRSVEDRDALRVAVRDGTIDAICSDHAPHDKDAKLAPFPSSTPGLSAFDGFLPLLLALPELLELSLADVLSKITYAPARIIDPATNYSLNNETQADLVVFDAEKPAQLSAEEFLSVGLNSPLLGLDNLYSSTGEQVPLNGQVTHCFVAGHRKS